MISEEERREEFEALLEEVEDILENPEVIQQVPEIRKIIEDFSESFLVLLIPDPDKEDFLKAWVEEEDHGNKIILSIYPLYPEDAKLGKYLSYYVQSVEHASYGPLSNTIYVNMRADETIRSLAYSFIHELGHFSMAKKENRLFLENPKSDHERAQEEIRIYSMEYKLMFALGDDNYKKAARDLASEIQLFWKRKRELPSFEGRSFVLDICLGKVPSQSAQKQRDQTFAAHCGLMAIDLLDDISETDKESMKLQLLKNFVVRSLGEQKKIYDSL